MDPSRAAPPTAAPAPHVSAFCEPPPPITELLWREGSAWAALLKLHSGVIAAARHAAGGGAGDEQLTLAREVVEAREGTYCAALTSLAAQAEALASESLKLRSLRRVRSSEEQLAIATLLEAHTVEALTMGASLASNMAVSTQAVSSELRRASQHARTELTQLHTLLQALRERADEPSLRLAVLVDDDNGSHTFEIDEVLQTAQQHDAELTEAGVRSALRTLSLRRAAPAPAAASQPRSLARRQNDRTISR